MEYHFIITLEFEGGMKFTADGDITIRPGVSKRQEIYKQLLEHMREQLNRNDGLTVLFFSLEPNQL